MELRRVMESRYSVRAYKPDPVEPGKLESVLQAANWAPTACNRQPFRLIVMETRGREAELGRIYHRPWFVQAPVIIAIVTLPDEAWSESKPNEAADLFMAIEAKSIPITWNGLEFSGSITSAWRGEGRIGDLKGVSQRTVRGKISKDARTIEELVVAERSLGTDGSDVGVTVIGVRLNGLSRFDTRAFTFSDGKWRKELLFSRWLRGLNSGADLDAAMPEFVWFRHSAWELAGRPMTRTEILKPESLESFQVTLMEFPPAMRVEQASERDKEGWRDSEISRVEMLAWLADGQDWQDGRGDPVAAVGRIQPVRPGQAAPSAAGTEGEAEADDTVQRIREHEANIQAVSRYLERLEADLDRAQQDRRVRPLGPRAIEEHRPLVRDEVARAPVALEDGLDLPDDVAVPRLREPYVPLEPRRLGGVREVG